MTSKTHNVGVSLSFAADPKEKRVLETVDLRSIISDVSRKPNVTHLSLQGNLFSSGALNLLTQYLRNSARIISLDVSMCGLGDRQSVEIVRAVCATVSRGRAATYLRKVDFSLNHITAEGATKMGILMAQAASCTLRDITLKYNNMGIAGFLALTRMQVPTQTLDCRYCGFELKGTGTTDGADSEKLHKFLQGIRESKTLKTLFLDGNSISEEAQEAIFNAIQNATHTKLTEDSVNMGPAAGELPAVAAYIAKVKHSVSDAESWYPADVLADCAKIDGEIAIVRGKLRGVDAPEPDFSRSASCRSRSVQRNSCVEIRQSGDFSSRSASLANRSVSRASRAPSSSRHADPLRPISLAPPVIKNKNNLNNTSFETEKETELIVDGQCNVDEEPQPEYQAPEAPTLVNSAITAKSRARSRSLVRELKESEKMKTVGPQNGLILNKGKTAKMALDRCVVSDEQLTEILNLPSTYEMEAGRGGRLGVPLSLQQFNATPSHLDSLENNCPERIGGIAKILYCILHAPGERCSMETLREMSDLPPSLRIDGASPNAICAFRSMRSCENRHAKEKVERCTTANTTNGTPAITANGVTPLNAARLLPPGVVASASRLTPASRGHSRGPSRRNSEVKSRYLDFYRSSSKASLNASPHTPSTNDN